MLQYTRPWRKEKAKTYVVECKDGPRNTFLSQAKMQFVEDEDVAEVHGNGPSKEVSAELRPDNKRDGHHEWREQVD